MNKNEQSLLSLIGLALDEKLKSFVSPDSWHEVLSLAAKHGVLGIAVDGLEKLPQELRPDTGTLMGLIGTVIKQEQQYQRNWKVACKLADFWKEKGINTYVLKGRAFAQYYPRPEHRYSCDLDVFIPNGWKTACHLLESRGVSLEYEVYKEAEFTFGGVYVECHRVITPVRGNKTLQGFERYLRGLLNDGVSPFEGTQLICPPLMFNVMLFVEHALGDFLQGKLLLKHVADWVVLRKQAVDWPEFTRVCEQFGFSRFVSLINAFADAVEGKVEFSNLSVSYQKEFNNIFHPHIAKQHDSWFGKRVSLFFEIIRNSHRFRHFGYCSMPYFLWNAVYSHFFRKEIEI